MADRINLRRARGGPRVEPTPSRSDRDAEAVRKAIVEEAERQISEGIDQYMDGWDTETLNPFRYGGTVTGRTNSSPPNPPPAPPTRNEGERPSSLTAPPPRTGGERSIFDRARALLGIQNPPDTRQEVVATTPPRMAPPIAPARSIDPSSWGNQRRSIRDGISVNVQNDVMTRSYHTRVNFTDLVMASTTTYEMLEMMTLRGTSDEQDRAIYQYAREVAASITRGIESELAQIIYELMHDNHHIR